MYVVGYAPSSMRPPKHATPPRNRSVPSTALRYYERALSRSPKFMPALLGAARSATKLGNDDEALEPLNSC